VFVATLATNFGDRRQQLWPLVRRQPVMQGQRIALVFDQDARSVLADRR